MQVSVYHIDSMRDFPSWTDSIPKIAEAVEAATYTHILDYQARTTPLYTDSVDGTPTPYNVLEDAFREFNIGDWENPNTLAHAYRRAGKTPGELGNRSLSVGDVVVVGDGAFVCASVGWVKVDFAGAR